MTANRRLTVSAPVGFALMASFMPVTFCSRPLVTGREQQVTGMKLAINAQPTGSYRKLPLKPQPDVYEHRKNREHHGQHTGLN